MRMIFLGSALLGIVITAAAWMRYTGRPIPILDHAQSEAADDAVLAQLYPLGLHTTPMLVSRADYLSIPAKLTRIHDLREWAQREVTDPYQRQAYQHWLDYFENENHSAARRYESRLDEIERQKWDEERREKAASCAAYLATHPLPKPPR